MVAGGAKPEGSPLHTAHARACRPTTTHAMAIMIDRILAVMILVIGAGETAAAADAVPATLQVDRPPGAMVTLKPGESFPHNVHIYCIGNGTPTIVLEGGIGASALSWWPVQQQLAGGYRTCTYDRAGYGWSAPGSASRTVDKLVDELHATLDGAGERAPYLLAGHSFGGMIAQYFAARYPGDVAGLVLVDSSHPQQPDMLDPSPSGGKINNPVAHVSDFEKSGMPQSPSEIASYLNTRRAAIFTQIDEIRSFRESAAMMSNAHVPDLPLTVISRGLRAWPIGEQGDAHEAQWQQLQKDLVALSSSGRQVIATASGHDIPGEQPSLVAVEIARLAQLLNRHGAAGSRQGGAE